MLDAHQEYSLCHEHASGCRVFNNSLGESTTIITEIRSGSKDHVRNVFLTSSNTFVLSGSINRAGRCTGNLAYSKYPESSHFLFNKRDRMTLIRQLGYTVHCRYLSWVCMGASRKAALKQIRTIMCSIHTVCNSNFGLNHSCKLHAANHNTVGIILWRIALESCLAISVQGLGWWYIYSTLFVHFWKICVQICWAFQDQIMPQN